MGARALRVVAGRSEPSRPEELLTTAARERARGVGDAAVARTVL